MKLLFNQAPAIILLASSTSPIIFGALEFSEVATVSKQPTL